MVIEEGERIAQFILNKVAPIQWVQKTSKSEFSDQNDRGGGFGSTGIK